MSNILNYENFAEVVNTKFRLTETEPSVEIALVEATPPVVTSSQIMFSLVFTGPTEYFLPQMTYQMTHETLGAVQLFLVPVGQTEDGYRYEAAFNRLVKK